MADYSRVTPFGWTVGDEADSFSRVTPSGWLIQEAAGGAGVSASASLTADSATLSALATANLAATLNVTAQDASISATAANAISAALNALATFGADRHSDISLNGHTLTWNYDATPLSARANIGRSNGDLFFEFVFSGAASDDLLVGVGSASAPLGSYVGQSADGFGYLASNGQKISNDVLAAYGATWSNGDVIGVRLSFNAAGVGTLTFYKNGSSQGAAYTNIPAGTYYPMVSAYVDCSGVFNFGDSDFSFTQPTGSSLWETVFTADNATLSATAYHDISASLAVTAENAVLDATATSTAVTDASLSVVAQDATLSASGTVAIAATADLTAADATLQASTTNAIAATADIRAQDATLQATAIGAADIIASFGITAENAILVATAYHDIAASLNVTAQDAMLSATAIQGEAPVVLDGPGFIDTALASRGRASTSLGSRGRTSTQLGPRRS